MHQNRLQPQRQRARQIQRARIPSDMRGPLGRRQPQIAPSFGKGIRAMLADQHKPPLRGRVIDQRFKPHAGLCAIHRLRVIPVILPKAVLLLAFCQECFFLYKC